MNADVSFIGILQCIGNQVVQNHSDNFLVEKQEHVFFFCLYQNLDVWFTV